MLGDFKSQLESFSCHSDVDVAEGRNPDSGSLHVLGQIFTMSFLPVAGRRGEDRVAFGKEHL